MLISLGIMYIDLKSYKNIKDTTDTLFLIKKSVALSNTFP